MRKYSSNLAFVDLLFNLLVGFTSLFVIAFLLINPIAKSGVIDPPIRLMIEMRWDDSSPRDIDLHVRGPDGNVVNFLRRTNGYITLKRDDVGQVGETYVINGEEVRVIRNYEITTMTDLPDGDYVVGVHFYSAAGSIESVNVRVTQIQPYATHFEGSVDLAPRQEKTVVVFRVVDGVVVDIRTDLEVRLRRLPVPDSIGFER